MQRIEAVYYKYHVLSCNIIVKPKYTLENLLHIKTTSTQGIAFVLSYF